MAQGAITRGSEVGGQASAPIFVERLSFPGDSAYPTGGTAAFEVAYQAATAQGRTIVTVVSDDCGDNKVEYDRVNDKLKVRVISTGAEVANTTDLSGVTFNVTVISK